MDGVSKQVQEKLEQVFEQATDLAVQTVLAGWDRKTPLHFSKIEEGARRLAGLWSYRRRWQAELYLRSLKIVLQMDHLQNARACSQRVLHASAGLQSDSRRDGGGFRVGPLTVGNQLQRDTANDRPVSARSTIKDFQRSVVRGVVDSRGHAHRWQSA
jgi:hypothetical protein